MELYSKTSAAGISATQAVDWHAVYTDLLPKVFHYFAYRVGNRQIAEDLTASTFERAWRKREKYRRDLGEFQSWVFGIAWRVGGEYFRKRWEDLPIEAASKKTDGSRFEERIELKDDFSHLSELLAQLPERERELVSLKYAADFTNRDIARITGLSESNVGTILHRLVKKLQEEWEKRS